MATITIPDDIAQIIAERRQAIVESSHFETWAAGKKSSGKSEAEISDDFGRIVLATLLLSSEQLDEVVREKTRT